MNKTVKISRMIQYGIAYFALFIILITGPLGLIKHHLTLKSTEIIAGMTEPVSVDRPVMQMFVPQCEEIENLQIYVCSENINTILQLRVKDASFDDLKVVQVDISNMQEAGFVSFEINLPVQIGQEYYYTVESLGEEALLALEEDFFAGVTTNGTYYYNGEEVPEVNLITRYDCISPLSFKRKSAYCIGVMVLAAALIFLTKKLFEKKLEDTEVLAGKWVKRIGNPVLAILTVACMAVVWPVKLFSERLLDIMVYESGILLLAAFLFYGLNHKRDEKYDEVKEKLPKYRAADILQSICIAEAVWYCIEYVNGLSNYMHYEAFRRVLIWMSLSMIVTFTKKELLTIANAVYLGIVVIAGIIYKIYFPGVLEEESLMMLTIGVAATGGIVILNVVRGLIKKQMGHVNVIYAVMLALLAALMIIFRHKWVWPIVMTVMFLVYYLRFGVWQKKGIFLANFANGILLSFAAVFVQCLLHRPYHYFMYVRYPMWFHTSTATAVYLTAVLCAALAKYFTKTKYSDRLADTWRELLIIGVVAGYLIMTLSRTGYVAIFAAGAVLLSVTAKGKGKEWFFRVGKRLLLLILTVLLSFPATFTVTRTIPAVVNEPFIYDIEVFLESIERGEKPNSLRYMTVARFVWAFNMRILGMDDKSAMIFGSDDPGYISMILDDHILVASADGTAGVGEVSGDAMFDMSDISSGRFDIFKSYWNQLNWTGHEVMSVDGKIMHAHNIYLQTAHDNGIAAGIMLVAVNIASVIFAYLFYRKKRIACAELPLAVMTAFLVAGIVEWNFHPCNPFGFIWLLTMAPLLFDKNRSRDEEKKTL